MKYKQKEGIQILTILLGQVFLKYTVGKSGIHKYTSPIDQVALQLVAVT